MLADSSSVEEGKKWLRKAEEENLTVPKLRAAIRKSKRDPHLDDDSNAPIESYSEVLAFNRWSRSMTRKVDTLTKQRAQAILMDLREAVALIETLRRKAS
jgi:hypothetical protein